MSQLAELVYSRGFQHLCQFFLLPDYCTLHLIYLSESLLAFLSFRKYLFQFSSLGLENQTPEDDLAKACNLLQHSTAHHISSEKRGEEPGARSYQAGTVIPQLCLKGSKSLAQQLASTQTQSSSFSHSPPNKFNSGYPHFLIILHIISLVPFHVLSHSVLSTSSLFITPNPKTKPHPISPSL